LPAFLQKYWVSKSQPKRLICQLHEPLGKDQGQISKAIDKLVEVGLVVRAEGRLMAQ